MRFYIFFRKKADVSVDFFFIVCAGLREVKEQKLIKNALINYRKGRKSQSAQTSKTAAEKDSKS